MSIRCCDTRFDSGRSLPMHCTTYHYCCDVRTRDGAMPCSTKTNIGRRNEIRTMTMPARRCATIVSQSMLIVNSNSNCYCHSIASAITNHAYTALISADDAMRVMYDLVTLVTSSVLAIDASISRTTLRVVYKRYRVSNRAVRYDAE